jgi:phage terminase small subunit
MAEKKKNKGVLTLKQEKFVNEYLIDLNATQAAIRAGYSEKTAKDIGCENLAKPNIAEAIGKAFKERAQRTKVDADWILKHCSEMLTADIGDILNDVGSFKPISEWPKIWRQMLSGCDIKELFDYEKGVKSNIGELIKAKFVSREKILELTGKHVNVGAFKENVAFNGNLTVEIVQFGDDKNSK